MTDVVHVQSVFSSQTPMALYYAKKLKRSVLLSPRGQFGKWCLDNGSRFKQQWLDWCIKPFLKSVVWHATSVQEKKEILSIFPLACVKVIPNGIDYKTFQRTIFLTKKEFMKKYTNKMLDTKQIIVSMGRFQKKKGFDILLDSFVKVLEKYPDAKLFIAGQDEGEKNNLLQQIKNLGLNE